MRFSEVNAMRIPKGSAKRIRHNGKTMWDKYPILARYVSLGDSIAAGHAINDNWEADYGERSQYGENGNTNPTIIVPNTYTDLIHNDLVAKLGGIVNATSFAHSGDTVADLMAKLDYDVVRNTIAKADYVTICIGANDVLQPALMNLERYIEAGDSALTEIASTVERNLAILVDDSKPNSYKTLFDKLYGINPNATYVFMTIYNPYKYLWLDEGVNGFFKPLLDTIPNMDLDVDKIIEDMFLGGTDLAYYDITQLKWVSIELNFDLDGIIKDGLLDTSAIRMLYDRVNGLCDWSERYVTMLNNVLREKVPAYGNGNFKLVDAKAAFDPYPDRPVAADVHYNDLVNVEFTRGYTTGTMDWGALWRGSDPATYWFDLAAKHTYWKFPGLDNLSWNVNDYVDFHLEDFAADLFTQIVEKVIVPNVDPHPEEYGHIVLKQVFIDELIPIEKKTVIVTNQFTGTNDPNIARVIIDGKVYDGSENTALDLPVGTTIECYVSSDDTLTTLAGVYVNGVQMTDNETVAKTYIYTISKNATINVHAIDLFGSHIGDIQITET